MALVYYAGHGLEIGNENWLLPVSSALKHERDLEYEAVSLNSILQAVKGASKLRLVILDACRNNPLGEKIEVASGTKRAVTRGLAPVEPSGDILVAYSAKHGTLAADGPAGANSPFASALLGHMKSPGLDVRLMFGKVRDSVKTATRGEQEPWLYGTMGGDTLALRDLSVEPKKDRQPPAPVSPPQESTSQSVSIVRTLEIRRYGLRFDRGYIGEVLTDSGDTLTVKVISPYCCVNVGLASDECSGGRHINELQPGMLLRVPRRCFPGF
jgi:hypothetical protein